MKERREQPNQRTKPPMITSTKNYTKKKPDRQNRIGQMVKAKLYRQNHTKKHTHTHSEKRKRKEIYISIYIKGREQPNQ